MITRVEAADAATLSEILPLAVAHARYERSAAGVPADWAEHMRQAVSAGLVDVFVARFEGRAVGYATATCSFTTWAVTRTMHMDCLFVSEPHRNAGIGRLLLDAVIVHARAKGFTELQWRTPAWNDGAIRFYQRMEPQQLAKEVFVLSLRPSSA